MSTYINRKIKTKYTNNNRVFISIPRVIYQNTDLNDTDVLVLSLITGYKAVWNAVGTDTIADYLNLSRATINVSVKKLVDLDLLQEKYVVARKRVFRSMINKEDRSDVISIITDSVLADNSISNVYKISLGVIVALSLGKNNDLGGFNFGRLDKKGIEELAERLNLSISSVYRHLAVLTDNRFINREYGKYTITVSDAFVRNHMLNVIKEKQAKASIIDVQSPPDELTPEIDAYLDSIYQQL